MLTPELVFSWSLRTRLLLTSLVLMMLAGCSSVPSHNRMTLSVNQTQIAYTYVPSIQTKPTPTIVFQAGLGDDSTVWRPVLQGLGKQFASFSYARPGYGASANTHAPRDPCSIAQEQHQVLQQAGIQPPFILVGHSLGGLYEYVYAQLYPEEVAGLVLLDPTHPQHLQQVQAEAPQAAALLSAASLLFTRAAQQEFKAQQTCLQQLKPSLAATIPVRLLFSSQRSAFEAGAFEQVLIRLRLDWQRMTRTSQIQSLASGHYIQTEQPAAVLTAIHQLLNRPH